MIVMQSGCIILWLQLQKQRKLDNAYGDDISLTDGQYPRKHINFRHLSQQLRDTVYTCSYAYIMSL